MKALGWVAAALLIVSAASAQVDRREGELHFADGTKRTFIIVNQIRHDPSYDAKEVPPLKFLSLFVNNAKVTLLFDKIDSMKVIPQAIGDSDIVRGDLEVTTIRGATFTTPISISEIVVTIYEDSTGAAKEIPFPFARNKRLFLRSILFPRSSIGM